jgi:hypothetical protein
MRRYEFISVFILFMVAVIFSVNRVNADDSKLKLVFRGMDDTRLSLNSGICHVTRMTQSDNKMITNDQCFIAFDYNKNFYRFDVEGHAGSAKTLRTSEYYYSTVKLDKEYEAVFRSSVNDISPQGFICLFDIRAIGLFTPYGPYWMFNYEKISEGLFTNLTNLAEINESSDGIIKFVLQAKPKENSPPPVKNTYFIDTKRGYTLVKFEALVSSRITNSHETSWKKINNQWVPVSFVLSSKQGLSAEWTFDWKLVNESVPMEYFDPNLLSEKPTTLFSMELGEPVRIGLIGKGVEPVTVQPKTKHSYFRYFLITAGLIMMLISLGKMGYDRWIRKSQT